MKKKKLCGIQKVIAHAVIVWEPEMIILKKSFKI